MCSIGSRFAVVGALVTGSLLSLASSNSFAQELPPRKAGLWEVKMMLSGDADSPPAAVTQQCVDEASDKKMMEMARGIQGSCSLNESTHSGDSYKVKSVCKLGESTVSSTAVFSGNFSDSYRATISATFEPPMMGMSSSSTSLEARYLGACKADQKPGDMIMPGGMKMNIFSMPKGMPGPK